MIYFVTTHLSNKGLLLINVVSPTCTTILTSTQYTIVICYDVNDKIQKYKKYRVLAVSLYS